MISENLAVRIASHIEPSKTIFEPRGDVTHQQRHSSGAADQSEGTHETHARYTRGTRGTSTPGQPPPRPCAPSSAAHQNACLGYLRRVCYSSAWFLLCSTATSSTFGANLLPLLCIRRSAGAAGPTRLWRTAMGTAMGDRSQTCGQINRCQRPAGCGNNDENQQRLLWCLCNECYLRFVVLSTAVRPLRSVYILFG